MWICCAFLRFYVTEPGYLVGKSAGLVIERLRVRIPAGAVGEFSSPELTLCAALIRCPFHPRVTTVARKRPRPFYQKCKWQKHLNAHTPLTHRSWRRLTMPLSRHSVGTYLEMSLHATRQGTFGHSRLSSLSHCGLILA